jgi:hypothetical protein
MSQQWHITLCPVVTFGSTGSPVTVPPEARTVAADDAEVQADGSLVLFDAADQPVYVAAPGRWVDCRLIDGTVQIPAEADVTCSDGVQVTVLRNGRTDTAPEPMYHADGSRCLHPGPVRVDGKPLQ